MEKLGSDLKKKSQIEGDSSMLPDSTTRDTVVDVGQLLKQINKFHFVKIWPNDTNPISNIEDAIKFIEDMNLDQFQISQKTKEKRVERKEGIFRLREVKDDDWKLRKSMDRRKEILNHLNLALDKLCVESNAFWRRDRKYSSSSVEKELHKQNLNIRMRHGIQSLVEEKRLLRKTKTKKQNDDASNSPLNELSGILYMLKWRYHHKKDSEQLLGEIQKFELAREAVDNAAMMSKIWSSKGLRKAMKNQVKRICDDVIAIRKKRKALEPKIKHASKELEAIHKEIWSYQTHLKDKHQGKEEAYVCILELSKRGRKEALFLSRSKLGHESCCCECMGNNCTIQWIFTHIYN
ncbi:proton pump-interactor 1-like [Quillaja saponaria]|uniref:Proton pump-interactor 1-like n=1 Tax=Quillaja saponaria TaxID=32244 RepID=A0AAD7LNI8_QUISA|nr:proton pump-interactor 1-like [Quillaja saponaria]